MPKHFEENAVPAASPSGYELIVIGTGPGGATVARDMALRGKKVLILEWGPGGPIRGNVAQGLTELMVPGKSLLFTPQLLGLVRGITTGGSSLFYYACAWPVPLAMFRRHGVDLAADAAAARAELPIAPLADAMMTPMAQRIMAGARDVGLDWRKLDKNMFQERWKPEHSFGYFGDVHGVKWSARMYVDEAVAHGAVLLNGAKVTRVLEGHGCTTGVEYVKDGRICTASAERIVLAAGGIGSPLILRASGLQEAGHDFFFDPLITVCGTMPGVRVQDNEIPMSAGVHLEDDGYMMTDLPFPPLMHALFAAQVGRLDKLFAYRSTARIMVKWKDALGGRLTDRGGVRKMLTAADKRVARHGFENAKRVLQAAGASDIYKTWYLAAHPGGTVKIGHLVDANLKSPIDGLYVCDCSVIPEAWGLPPSLTLVALGKRLARCLAVQRSTGELSAASRAAPETQVASAS
ncbi:FAD-dependent oxidoreductase [Piscinibacter sp.]|uniref:FAD-dependent oxidoreductase n=1 Tax=Piscinibacter sp. TaxID=1903157 RepID=UPI002B7E1912|nr:FAD-dependent oxidoreductase [Albitalea sp.]HUG23511.1 FAD-dependent oxidoreductase [Albitalea sp.]